MLCYQSFVFKWIQCTIFSSRMTFLLCPKLGPFFYWKIHMACTCTLYPFWFLSNFEIFFLKVWFFNLSNFQMAWSKSKMRIQSQFALILWTQKSTAKFFGSSVFFPSFFCFSSWTELNTSLASCEIIIMCYSVCASLLEKKKRNMLKSFSFVIC